MQQCLHLELAAFNQWFRRLSDEIRKKKIRRNMEQVKAFRVKDKRWVNMFASTPIGQIKFSLAVPPKKEEQVETLLQTMFKRNSSPSISERRKNIQEVPFCGSLARSSLPGTICRHKSRSPDGSTSTTQPRPTQRHDKSEQTSSRCAAQPLRTKSGRPEKDRVAKEEGSDGRPAT